VVYTAYLQHLLEIFENYILERSFRICTIDGNLTRKFAYDGLNQHTLLASRHYGRMRRKSAVRKRGFVEGIGRGDRCSDEARAVERSPSRVPLQAQHTRQRQPESSLVRFRHSPQWRLVTPVVGKWCPSFLTMNSANSGLHLPQLINRRGGHVYYIRPRSKEEDQGLGTTHRTLC
jgi:hypothetical protein